MSARSVAGDAPSPIHAAPLRGEYPQKAGTHRRRFTTTRRSSMRGLTVVGFGRLVVRAACSAAVARRDALAHLSHHAELFLGEARDEVLAHDPHLRAAGFLQAFAAGIGDACICPARVVIARAAVLYAEMPGPSPDAMVARPTPYEAMTMGASAVPRSSAPRKTVPSNVWPAAR